MQQSDAKYLDVLQIYRGIAAMMVVVHHAVGSLKFYHHFDNATLSFVGGVGKYGVDFFFVLSGFIISYSAYFKFGKPNAFSEYVKNRLLRIYVPYLPIGIAMVILYLCFPTFSNANRDISILTSLTLIPDGNPALSVAWTLLFELLFYFLFSIAFLSKNGWNFFVVMWSAVIIAVNYTPLNALWEVENPFLKIFLSFYNLEFILGYLLSVLVIKKIKLPYISMLCLVIAAAAGFLAAEFFKWDVFDFLRNLAFALFTFSLIYFSVLYANRAIHKGALLMLVGNATYSIYLIHNPLQMLLIRFAPKISSSIYITFVLAAVLLVCCLVGYLYYLVFEKYAMNTLKSKI